MTNINKTPTSASIAGQDVNKNGKNVQVDELREIHKPVIDFMETIGYGLMLDDKTFYQKGYELNPHLVPTFEINQAYIMYNSFTHQLELAKIAERLDIRGRINYIHDKYPGDSTEDDRLFRNEFMKMFSEYMDETTKMVKSLSELTKQKEEIKNDRG